MPKPPPVPAGAIRVGLGWQFVPFYRTVVSRSALTINLTIVADEPDAYGEYEYKLACGPFDCTTTTFVQSTATGSLGNAGYVPRAGWLVAATCTAAANNVNVGPGQFWLGLVVASKPATVGSVAAAEYSTVITKFFNDSGYGTQGAWEWRAGEANQEPFFGPTCPAKLYTFQGTVVNGAGGAGDNTLTVTPAAGSRIEVESFTITNNDTSARTQDAQVQDGAGNLVRLVHTIASAAVGEVASWPNAIAPTAALSFGSSGPTCTIAGANILILRSIAVAASQDTNFACVLRVWGAAPTMTLAGASTPTLTTNTSRFETG